MKSYKHQVQISYITLISSELFVMERQSSDHKCYFCLYEFEDAPTNYVL
jgi:hypothetical protein